MQCITPAAATTTITGMRGRRTWTDVALWILQAVLALFFVFANGAPKLLLPVERLNLPIDLPQAFIWFIGTAEVLGGLGLVLPGLLRRSMGLTPLAATGLALVTVGATVYQLAAGQPASALFAVAVGSLAAAVAYGRRHLAR
jgi:hypothetical protein